MNVLQWNECHAPHVKWMPCAPRINSSVLRLLQKQDDDEVKSLMAAGVLVESSKLQDHRQQSCVICNLTVKRAGLSGHHMKTNIDRSEWSSLIPECTQICQVWRCSVTKTLIDQWPASTEQDTWSHLQLMEVVHGAGNIFELSLASDEMRRSV